MPRRSANNAFLTSESLVQATAKRLVRDDVAIDTDTLGKALDAAFTVLFERASSEKRVVGDYFENKLFKMTIKERDEKLARNPKTGAAIAKGSTRVVAIKASKELSDAMDATYRRNPSKKLRDAEDAKNGVVREPEAAPTGKKGGKLKLGASKKVDEE